MLFNRGPTEDARGTGRACSSYARGSRPCCWPALAIAALLLGGSALRPAAAEGFQSPHLMLEVTGENQQLELTSNTSRILTLDKNIPRVQVNNPELVAVTPLSATQVQISAKKAGVTQVNLWDEDDNIHTIDVMIYGDVAELNAALKTQFPNSTIQVFKYSESLVLKGFVDQPEHVDEIVSLASDYGPKVINNITVGGVQQVLLKVRVMEISRTKLRELGVDWAYFGNGGDFAVNSVSGLIGSFDSGAQTLESAGETFSFGIVNSSSSFFGVLDALEERNVGKTLAEPNIVAVSGRPAKFLSGGEVPYVIPGGVGNPSTVQWKPFGTEVDFLPIVLGNGSIRLEVRPKVSEIDESLSVAVDGQGDQVPGFRTRLVDTGVEMKAGQTFALAGLVQERTESRFAGLPYVSNVPIIGVPFRRTEDTVNEVELLILVTPEFVGAIEPHEVPCGGPGYATTTPTNRDLYCGGHLEVPAHCNPISGPTACGECGMEGCTTCGMGGSSVMGGDSVITDGLVLPGGTGYDDSYGPTPQGPTLEPGTFEDTIEPEAIPLPPSGPPRAASPRRTTPRPRAQPPVRTAPPGDSGAGDTSPPATGGAAEDSARRPSPAPTSRPRQASRPYHLPRQPVYMRNAAPAGKRTAPASRREQGELIGPVGYEAR